MGLLKWELKKSRLGHKKSAEVVVSSFLEIIKRIEHDEILCQCQLCKPESYNKRFIWSISETIKLIKKNC